MAETPARPSRAPVKDEEEPIPPPHAHAQDHTWGARAPGRLARGAGRRSERALVREAQRGSSEAFEELFRRHWPRAHRTAFLIVGDAAAAEDIAQEAFLAAVRALDRFDRRRPLGPWLSRIVANRAIDWARARAVRREVDAAQAPEAVARPGDPSRPWSDAVVTALGSLSPEHRAVIVLRHLLEYTPGEIARALDLPRGTVNSRLRRGLDGLEAALREEAEVP
jgi:RNA polymerase sigma-70 factor (ECF subfamily)